MAQNSSLAKKVFPQIDPKAEFGPAPAATAPSASFHSISAATQPQDEQKDYFVEQDGMVFAGSHILADLWGATRLDDQDHIERALRTAAAACNATLLHVHLHRFAGSGGVSGVAVLAESHISVHTWPERNFAAFDVFMCGKCNPMDALPVLRAFFEPEDMLVEKNRRGIVR
jgi:S-adenosylmethionine decarboxylase